MQRNVPDAAMVDQVRGRLQTQRPKHERKMNALQFVFDPDAQGG